MNELNDQQFRDRLAIHDLTVSYTWALDERRFEDLRNVFTPDATFDVGGAVHVGIDAIITKISSALIPLDESQHLIANHQIAVNGDQATSRCYLQGQHVRRGTDGGDNYIIAGRYEDQLVRTADGWRIQFRKLVRVWSEGNLKVVRPRPGSLD